MMASTTRTPKIAQAVMAPSAMTTPAQLERLGEHLRKLRLLKSGERLEALLQHAAAQELPYAEFLEQVLGEEVAAKTSKNIAMRTAMARLPFVKPLETFEFDYQPSIDRKQVQALASCHFIEHGDNVIVLGPPGVGKTHLAIGLGRAAVETGHSVLFTNATALLAALAKAESEGSLRDKLNYFAKPKLLVIDELGYLPFEKRSAHLLAQQRVEEVQVGGLGASRLRQQRVEALGQVAQAQPAQVLEDTRVHQLVAHAAPRFERCSTTAA